MFLCWSQYDFTIPKYSLVLFSFFVTLNQIISTFCAGPKITLSLTRCVVKAKRKQILITALKAMFSGDTGCCYLQLFYSSIRRVLCSFSVKNTFFLACVTIRTNFLKCFAVTQYGMPFNCKFLSSMWSANLIWVRSRIRWQVRWTRKNCWRSNSIGDILAQHCASDCGSGCFKVKCILSLILGASD